MGMEVAELIKQAKALIERVEPYASGRAPGSPGDAAKAQVCEFLRVYAGPRSAFLRQAEEAVGVSHHVVPTLQAIVQSFAEFLRAGLATGFSPERQAQMDVVSDILGQARSLLDNKKYHPAAAAILIGASLEEFLRNWVEDEGLSIGNSKPGLDTYCKLLRSAGLITKQDVKDIGSWGGTRNSAAHGEWSEVSDVARVRLMLEGVNLFMRQKQGAER